MALKQWYTLRLLGLTKVLLFFVCEIDRLARRWSDSQRRLLHKWRKAVVHVRLPGLAASFLCFSSARSTGASMTRFSAEVVAQTRVAPKIQCLRSIDWPFLPCLGLGVFLLLFQIVERGDHDSLMELGGEYAAMWNIQVQEREKMLEMEAVSSSDSQSSPGAWYVLFFVWLHLEISARSIYLWPLGL